MINIMEVNETNKMVEHEMSVPLPLESVFWIVLILI